MQLSVVSLGGSIIAPDNVDVCFLSSFFEGIRTYLDKNPEAKLVFVCGGGAPARRYQNAFRELCTCSDGNASGAQDWIGIRATHLNAQLVKAVLGNLCTDPLVTDPSSDKVSFNGRVLVAGGWKPGFSTDTDAVYLARRFGGRLVINLSNIKKVYSDDPKKNPDAVPYDSISWEDFRKIVGDEWVPGKNVPFDPVASAMAQEAGIKVVCADGRNIENTIAILEGRAFTGTTIG